MKADMIGGFPERNSNCKGCGKPLLIENAWMTDGCPCNTPLGINSMNETRWRLLMQLQQQQLRDLEKLRAGQSAGGDARTMIAARAMQGLLANCTLLDMTETQDSKIAEMAVAYADALLAALERGRK